jgi:hypothetical protein
LQGGGILSSDGLVRDNIGLLTWISCVFYVSCDGDKFVLLPQNKFMQCLAGQLRRIDCEGSWTWRHETDFRKRCRESTVIRAADARIQLGSHRNRADCPNDPNPLLIRYVDGLSKESCQHFLRFFAEYQRAHRPVSLAGRTLGFSRAHQQRRVEP